MLNVNDKRTYDVNFSFNRRYIIDFNTLDLLTYYIVKGFTPVPEGSMFNEPSQYINSVMVFPFKLDKFVDVKASTKQNIIIGTDKTNLYQGYRLSRSDNPPLCSICIGYVYVKPIYNNFIDYTKVKIAVQLPYSNIIELDVISFMKRNIYLFASLDFETGVLNLYITRSKKTFNNQTEADEEAWTISSVGYSMETYVEVLQTEQIQIGARVSIGANSANSLALQTTMAQINAVGQIGSGVLNIAGGAISSTPQNVLAGGSQIIQGATSVINNVLQSQVNTVQKGNKPSGNIANFIAVDYPILYMTYPTISPNFDYANYRKYVGGPLLQTKQLSSLSGFTVCDNFHLENFNTATKQELDLLDTTLRSGIIL